MKGRPTISRKFVCNRRAQKRLTNPNQTPVRKAYICPKFPHLRVRGIVFDDGWVVTDKPEEQARIEQEPNVWECDL
jgi:hypothetical protein